MEKVIFYILAIIMVASAIAAVSSRKMLRSVVYLLFVLIGAAGLYFQMDYNFLAAIQLTVYAGGVVVLIIFSVLLIQHIEMQLEVARKSRRAISALLCLLGLSVFLATIYAHPFEAAGVTTTTTTAEIGRALLSFEKQGFILPFEVISVLLLSAMIGAIVIAKGGRQIKQPPFEKLDPEKILQGISKEVNEEKVPEEEIGV
ncbi:NADH-quinone oxidoreductase subunit J family protein [Salinimicrobium sediminilitoris]|uniref:NADH-quinone oxidoreductase subunit J family protein n=1 Tax=Salinimicrobium sediminilitoris TaxID=2876715 RepID=UPI001E408399|nr:NADH-quinone oxidoreductase subunit J [Salinimicrobium sediminilitoris]MCC8361373.1 NADH-quinone oxidoreductase subunit J [Salinimicrobium sediminilitoris]